MQGRRPALVTFVGVMLALLAGCASASHTVKGTPTFTNTKDPIEVPLGQRFHVSLPSTPGTGYSWRIGQTQPPLVEQTGARYVPPGTGRVGAAGRQVFDFRATAKGSGALALVSVGPGRDAPVGRTEQFRVTVR